MLKSSNPQKLLDQCRKKLIAAENDLRSSKKKSKGKVREVNSLRIRYAKIINKYKIVEPIPKRTQQQREVDEQVGGRFTLIAPSSASSNLRKITR